MKSRMRENRTSGSVRGSRQSLRSKNYVKGVSRLSTRLIKMLVKNAENRGQLEFVSLENMVAQDHLLRKIDAAIDFKKIYEFVEDLYCEDNGRPSVDPVVLFKIVLIQHIYGIPSLRRTLEEVSMNLAYRWFIGYPLNEAVPHFSTVSYNFKHRFNHSTVEYVFRWVLKAAAEEGYLDTEAIFVDGTHIKASANLKKQAKKAVPKQAKRYAKELFAEVNRDREEHGKKPFSDDSDKNPPPEKQTKETVVSTTDPESGVFHKGEHKKCFAYEAHTACDKHNFVLGVYVTPGNVHDSVAFDPLYDEVCRKLPRAQNRGGGQRLQNALDLQKDLRERPRSFHLLYPSQDQRERPSLVDVCV